MDDERILRLFQMRAPDAIEQTDRKYGALCRSLAGKLLREPEDVEECVNDTYLTLWNAIPPAEPLPLRPYVARITRNLAFKRLEHLTAEKRNAQVVLSFQELDACIPTPNTPEELVEAEALRQTILQFLQSERQESRILFLRRYFFFDSIEEIARNYGLSQSKVKSSLKRTRDRLKFHLMQEGYYL